MLEAYKGQSNRWKKKFELQVQLPGRFSQFCRDLMSLVTEA